MPYDNYDYDDNYFKKSFSKIKPVKATGASEVLNYFRKIYNVRKLPDSPLEGKDFFATRRGFFDLSTACALKSEQEIYGNNKKNYHEKSWPQRIGILKDENIVVPHYFREFEMQGEMHNATSKINANIVCGRLFPTSMRYYVGYYNGRFGTVGIDLNNIDGVKSIRLDKYLESKGIEFNSVVSMMKAYKKGVFSEDLTNSAISQLMISMFSLPNAIGEQDPNTRNAILLGPDKIGAKYDSLVRIDFENNRILSSPHERIGSENTGDVIRVYPFGIYGRDESKFELKEGIEKAVKDGDIDKQDSNTILSLNDLTKQATRRTVISNAIGDAENAHKHINENGQACFCDTGDFAFNNLDNIGESIIARAENYCFRLEDYFKDAGINSHQFELPNLEQ